MNFSKSKFFSVNVDPCFIDTTTKFFKFKVGVNTTRFSMWKLVSGVFEKRLSSWMKKFGNLEG